MILKSWLKMFFQSRPANPPAGEVYIYPDAQTGKPVWQDSGGVHEFGTEGAIIGATMNADNVPVEDNKLVLDGIIGSGFSEDFTFIVDSDEALAAWANNAAGNDYTSVLIKPGTWTSSKEVNLTNAGTKAATGMPASLLSFTSGYGLKYNSTPTSAEYWMRGVNATAEGSGDEYISFFNCTNLMNCTGAGTSASSEDSGIGFKGCTNLVNCTGTGAGTNDGYSYGHGFSICTNLTNCTGTGTSSNYGHSYGFYGCVNLTNCAGTGTCTSSNGSDDGAVGFRDCTNLVNCAGTGNSMAMSSGFQGCTNLTNCTGISIGNGSNRYGFIGCTNLISCTGTGAATGDGFGFLTCRIMLFCKPGSTPSSEATYSSCYMYAEGTDDPVGDTAAGGWNRS
jgi:hypothetical protein